MNFLLEFFHIKKIETLSYISLIHKERKKERKIFVHKITKIKNKNFFNSQYYTTN